MATIRTKFKIETVSQHCWGGESIEATPVQGGSEENKSFWKATPSGALKFDVTNPEVIGKFKAGQEYYVDFTEAN